jgi:hypothetical protein
MSAPIMKEIGMIMCFIRPKPSCASGGVSGNLPPFFVDDGVDRRGRSQRVTAKPIGSAEASSALPLEADDAFRSPMVGYGPLADMATLFDYLVSA